MPKFSNWRTVGDVDLTALTPSGSWSGDFGAGGTATQLNSGAVSARTSSVSGITTTSGASGTHWGDDTYSSYADSLTLNGFYGAAAGEPLPTAATRWRAWLSLTQPPAVSDGQFVYFGWTGPGDPAHRLHALCYYGHFTSNLIGFQATASQGNITPESAFFAAQPTGPVDVLMVELASPWTFRLAYGTMGGGSAWPDERSLKWVGSGSVLSYPTVGTYRTYGLSLPTATPGRNVTPSILFAHTSQSAATPYTVVRKRLRLQEFVL